MVAKFIGNKLNATAKILGPIVNAGAVYYLYNIKRYLANPK
jgi:hypothetical protein